MRPIGGIVPIKTRFSVSKRRFSLLRPLCEPILEVEEDSSALKLETLFSQIYSNSPTPLSDVVRVAGRAVSGDTLKAEALHLLHEFVVQRKRNMSAEDICSVLSVALEGHRKGAEVREMCEILLLELKTPSRMSELVERVGVINISVVVHAQARLGIRESELSRICLDSLASKLADLSAAHIASLLSDMIDLKVSHQRLLESVVFLLPAIPCNDEELKSISESLVSLNAGSQKDREFLLNLVKFRNVVVLD